ncbi:MAG TPA: hypothetical protein VGV13_00975, partial [Methylomirabilota bacterium]|nr:hypothetical protein [Methylomirabilota bacterium]
TAGVDRIERLAPREAHGQVRQRDIDFRPIEMSAVELAVFVRIPDDAAKSAGNDDGALETLTEEVEAVDQFLRGLGGGVTVGAPSATAAELIGNFEEAACHHNSESVK